MTHLHDTSDNASFKRFKCFGRHVKTFVLILKTCGRMKQISKPEYVLRMSAFSERDLYSGLREVITDITSP